MKKTLVIITQKEGILTFYINGEPEFKIDCNALKQYDPATIANLIGEYIHDVIWRKYTACLIKDLDNRHEYNGTPFDFI